MGPTNSEWSTPLDPSQTFKTNIEDDNAKHPSTKLLLLASYKVSAVTAVKYGRASNPGWQGIASPG
jgi:hypothetical protein